METTRHREREAAVLGLGEIEPLEPSLPIDRQPGLRVSGGTRGTSRPGAAYRYNMRATHNPGRVAGLWYLFLILLGPLRLIYIPNKLSSTSLSKTRWRCCF
jgi:hypothetical protein